jgi:hypothetical protein
MMMMMIDNEQWSNRWNAWQEKLKYSEKTCPSAALSTWAQTQATAEGSLSYSFTFMRLQFYLMSMELQETLPVC